MPAATIQAATALGMTMLPFGEDDVAQMAKVRKATKPLGLSLGDRCCLATAMVHNHPVLTADRVLGQVKIRGLRIQLLNARK